MRGGVFLCRKMNKMLLLWQNDALLCLGAKERSQKKVGWEKKLSGKPKNRGKGKQNPNQEQGDEARGKIAFGGC